MGSSGDHARRYFHATLQRMRARVPVSRLFITIFLWFWLTAWGMLAMVLMVNDLKGIRQVTAPSLYSTIAPVLAVEAAKVYEAGGTAAFARLAASDVEHDRQLFLLDGFYNDVLGAKLTNESLKIARATKYGQLVMLHNNIAAYRFVSSSGRPYILMLRLSSTRREINQVLLGKNVPYALCLMLMVTALCLALAYHIAAPIHSIQSTARRVAEGDLKARVPSRVSKRFDELASLAKDFDTMVGRLEVMIRTQKNLLNSVSHELRSPLARINLSVALLRKRYPDEAKDMLERLDRDVAKIDILMEQLLTLSRFEGGGSSIRRGEVDLAELVEGVVADSDFEAKAFGRSVSFVGQGKFMLANADPYALRSACENVIRNAVKFTQPGTDVAVVVKFGETPSGGLGIVSVRDRGPGVPEECLAAIFQPFYRIQSYTRDASNGNGLGLAIAAEAIRLHRGTIRAENLLPSGLEMIISLPLCSTLDSL